MKPASALFSATACLLLSAAAVLPAARAQLPAGATLYASGLDGPRGLAFGPDGDLYVAEAGLGGSTSTKGICAQVPAPVGPYTGGQAARISRINPNGSRIIITSNLPSSMDALGDYTGVADLVFLEDKLYALVTGGGCSHGNVSLPNGIVQVDQHTGKWSYITNLSAFYAEHPAAYPNADDFEPDGVPYSLLAHNGYLVSIEPNHGTIVLTTTDGASKLLYDASLTFGHVVPSGIAIDHDNLYVGAFGNFPVEPTRQTVFTLSQFVDFTDTTPGFTTPAPQAGQFRLAASRAGFTSILSLKFGPDGLLYVLEFSDAAGNPTPGAGKIVRVTSSGKIEDVVTGLTVPTGMTFGPDHALYVSNVGAAGPHAGQILRFEIH